MKVEDISYIPNINYLKVNLVADTVYVTVTFLLVTGD